MTKNCIVVMPEKEIKEHNEYVRSGLLTSTYEKSIGLCYNWVG